MIEGQRAFQLFTALKLHFTTDYNFFKYNGKMRPVNEANLQLRRDYNQFRRIERRYGDELEKFILANLITNENAWVSDLLSTEAEKRWWKRPRAAP